MSASSSTKALLALTGKKQVELAEHFGMLRQTMNNKFGRDGWSAHDLIKVAEFCGCKLAYVLPDGQQIEIAENPVGGSIRKEDHIED